MDLSRYADVLDRSIKATRPLEAILTSVSAGKRLDRDECRILAFNAWGLDPEWSLENRAWLARMSDLLHRSAEACSPTARLERARLEIAAASAASKSEAAAIKAGKAPSASLAALAQRVYPLLEQDGAGDALIGLPTEFFIAAKRSDPASVRYLEQRFSKVMDALAADPRYAVATQLDAVNEKLRATHALEGEGKIPAPIAEVSRQRVAAELAKVPEPHSRASVVNAALAIYHELGDDELAYQLLLAETRTSATPYYYMPELAELEEKRGHKDRAVEWLARAYRESQGPQGPGHCHPHHVGRNVRERIAPDAARR